MNLDFSHLILADAQKKPICYYKILVLFIAPRSMKRFRFSTLKKMEPFYGKRKDAFFFIKRCSQQIGGKTSNSTTQCSKIGKKVQFQKYKNKFFTISKMAKKKKNQFLHQKKV